MKPPSALEVMIKTDHRFWELCRTLVIVQVYIFNSTYAHVHTIFLLMILILLYSFLVKRKKIVIHTMHTICQGKLKTMHFCRKRHRRRCLIERFPRYDSGLEHAVEEFYYNDVWAESQRHFIIGRVMIHYVKKKKKKTIFIFCL